MKAKILIVDDDPDIATMLEDRLQASDYGTVIAKDGVEALELVEQEAPHLMLLDLDMPRMTGLEVLKRLPKVRPAEDLPVIVMTAHASIDAAVEAMKTGAYDFLTKPLDKDHLLLVINKALERGGGGPCPAAWSESRRRRFSWLRRRHRSRHGRS